MTAAYVDFVHLVGSPLLLPKLDTIEEELKDGKEDYG
jgi:hypothetical protein